MIIIPLGDDVEKKYFPTVTVLLIAASVIAFIYEARLARESTSAQALVSFVNDWGLVPLHFARGKMIGAVTHMFLHADLLHLLGNMLFFWAFARTLEDALGGVLFLGLYLLSGLAGGLSHVVLNAHANVPLIGASGAIAGVIGAYCIGFGTTTTIRTFVWFFKPRRYNVPTCVYAVLWLLLQSHGAFTSEEGAAGVAWMAHLGGFVAGSVVMVAFQQVSGRCLLQARDGSLEIADVSRKKSFDKDAENAEDDYQPEVFNCRYCGADLTEEQRIAENLWRCPNPDCNQLHIETEPMATAASAE